MTAQRSKTRRKATALSMKLTGAAALSSLFFVSPKAFAFPQACSEIFLSGELAGAMAVKAAPKKIDTSFIRSMNAKTNAELAKSSNRTSIEAFFRKSLSQSNVEAASLKTIDERTNVAIVRMGLGQPDSVVFTQNGKFEVLMTSTDLSRNHTWRIEEISLSPDKKYLVIKSTENGALDKFKISVVDMATRKVIRADLEAHSLQVNWVKEGVFYFQPTNAKLYAQFGVFNAKTPESVGIYSGSTTGDKGWSAIKENGVWLVSNYDRQSIRINGDFGSVIGEDANYLYFKELGSDWLGKIQRVSKSLMKSFKEAKLLPAISAETLVPEKPGSMITSVELKGDRFFVKRRWGAELSVQILDVGGTEIGTIPISSQLRAVSISYAGRGQKYNVKLSSAVSASKEFVYDLATKKWDRETFEEELLTVDGIKMESDIVMYESEGAKIPMRIVRRKDLPRDGERPVLIEAYGGFGHVGPIDGDRLPMNDEFLKRGGIIAWPAVHGGSEFGANWYSGAVGEKKRITMLDLIASSRYLAKAGWTKPEKIAIYGASNGGFVVASAALLAPDAFGLVIPAAGVLDPAAIMDLDPSTGPYWRYDYGNPQTVAGAVNLEAISPVELAKKMEPGAKLPKFVVIVGLNDDRVNPLHSERFAKVMAEKAPNSIKLIGLKNSGHFVYSLTYNDLIGLRASTIKWTTIFDTFGMKF